MKKAILTLLMIPAFVGMLFSCSEVKTDAKKLEGKSKKVIVYRYKRKTGYHKKNGHRQPFTQVKIEKINA